MSNYKRFLIYFIGSFSLLLGLVLNENSSGGAKIDFEYLFPYIEGFSVNLSDGLNFYIRDSASIIHSPVFYVCILTQLPRRLFPEAGLHRSVLAVILRDGET